MNWARVKRATLLSLLVAVSASCSTQPDTTSPSAQSLFAPFNGDWLGTAVLTSVTPFVTGACVSPSLATLVSSTDQLNLAISQDGQKLTAHRSSATTGLSCSYTGTTSSNRIALDAAECDFPDLILRCTDNVSTARLNVVGSTIQGTVLNGQLTATVTDSFNAEDRITRVTLSYQFAAAKP
jgi:hypothetical protein